MKYQLKLENINKSYGKLQANKNISLKIKPASIHALLGENGAGKSTLVNIIYGIVRRNSGEVFWQDEKVEINSPNFARKLGIGIVFQHFALFEVLTVLENIALGIDFKGNLKDLEKHINKIGERYKLPIEPNAKVATLSTGQKQRVEIIRCLLQDPKLLILDEPTSVLTPAETENLFITLRQLKEEGRAILFIGHKLNEIKEICETSTILRNGEFIGDFKLKEFSVPEIAQKMVGGKVNEYSQRSKNLNDEVVFKANYKNHKTKLNIENLELKKSTIIGVAGISGNGQDELMSFLSGEILGSPQNIQFKNNNIGDLSIDKKNRMGILSVPTERLGRSAIPQLSLIENSLLSVSDKKQFVKNGMVNYFNLKNFTNKIIKKFSVKTSSDKSIASSLSGGNLQKFIVGRAILQSPKVLLISNPTWGVDISSAIFIRNCLLELRDQGVAILVASEDLDELFTICDEIAVIREGKLGNPQKVSNLNLQKVGLLMTK